MPSSTTCILPISVLILPLLTGPALAQSTPAADEPAPELTVVELDVVRVQGAEYDARRSDTSTRIVISNDELRRHGDANLVEALKRLPGVSVGAGEPGRSGVISLRGLGAGYTQILVDGQKAPAGFSIEQLTPETVERIEIVRAPTADMANEGIAGTLNIVLAHVARKDTSVVSFGLHNTDGRNVYTATWHDTSSRDHSNRSLIATTNRRDFLVNETGIETGQELNGEETLRRVTDLRATGRRDALSLTPSFNLSGTGGEILALRGHIEASNFRRNANINWNTLYGPDLAHARYHQHTDIDLVVFNGSANWTHPFENGGTLTARITLGGNRESYAYNELGYAVDGQRNLEERTTAKTRVDEIAGNSKYMFPSTASHRIELGWEAGEERREDVRRQQQLPFGDAAGLDNDLSFDARIRRGAVYLQDEMTLAPHWSLYLGLRWEWIETRSAGTGFSLIDQSAGLLAPQLQSLWKLPGEGRQIRLALSRTWRPPALNSLIARPYTSTNNRALSPDSQGNPALRPERAVGLDLSWEAFAEGGVQSSLGGYVRRITNVIRNETRLIDERWVNSPVNGGDATTWGIEMDAKFPLRHWFDDAPDVDMRFNATRNWSHLNGVPGPDNRLAKQIRYNATLALDHRMTQAWTLGVSYTHRSGGAWRSSVEQIDLAGVRRELDAYALWSPNKSTKLRFGVSNLLSEEIDSGIIRIGVDGIQSTYRSRDTEPTFRLQFERSI